MYPTHHLQIHATLATLSAGPGDSSQRPCPDPLQTLFHLAGKRGSGDRTEACLLSGVELAWLRLQQVQLQNICSETIFLSSPGHTELQRRKSCIIRWQWAGGGRGWAWPETWEPEPQTGQRGQPCQGATVRSTLLGTLPCPDRTSDWPSLAQCPKTGPQEKQGVGPCDTEQSKRAGRGPEDRHHARVQHRGRIRQLNSECSRNGASAGALSTCTSEFC